MRIKEKKVKAGRAMGIALRTVLVSVMLTGAALAVFVFTDGFSFIGGDNSRVAAFDTEVERTVRRYYDVEYSPGVSYDELRKFDRKFERYPSGAVSLNEEFGELWNAHGDNLLDRNLKRLPYTHHELGDRTEPHVGGLIRKEYTFKNVSSIPVYLRVSAPEVRGDINASAHFINFQDGQDAHVFLDAGDGFIYWRDAIEPDYTVSIEVIAYVPHRGNEDIGNPIKADIFVEYAEILQATNHAIFYAEGWREVAEKGVFAPQAS